MPFCFIALQLILLSHLFCFSTLRFFYGSSRFLLFGFFSRFLPSEFCMVPSLPLAWVILYRLADSPYTAYTTPESWVDFAIEIQKPIKPQAQEQRRQPPKRKETAVAAAAPSKGQAPPNQEVEPLQVLARLFVYYLVERERSLWRISEKNHLDLLNLTPRCPLFFLIQRRLQPSIWLRCTFSSSTCFSAWFLL